MPSGARFISETGYSFQFGAGDYIWGEATCAGNVHVQCSLPVGSSNNFFAIAVPRNYAECRVGNTVKRVNCPRTPLVTITPEGLSFSQPEEVLLLVVECESGLCFSEGFEESCAERFLLDDSEEWRQSRNPDQRVKHCTGCCIDWSRPCLLSCTGDRGCETVCMVKFRACIKSCT